MSLSCVHKIVEHTVDILLGSHHDISVLCFVAVVVVVLSFVVYPASNALQ